MTTISKRSTMSRPRPTIYYLCELVCLVFNRIGAQSSLHIRNCCWFIHMSIHVVLLDIKLQSLFHCRMMPLEGVWLAVCSYMKENFQQLHILLWVIGLKMIRLSVRSLAMILLWQHHLKVWKLQAMMHMWFLVVCNSCYQWVGSASYTLIQERTQWKCGGLICSQPWLPPAQDQFVQMKPFIGINVCCCIRCLTNL
jgi:hypothetical protein